MRLPKLFLLTLSLLVAVAAPVLWYTAPWESTANNVKDFESDDPDLPPGLNIDKDEYMRLRNEQIAYIRGLDTAKPESRGRAIRDMERSQSDLAARRKTSSLANAAEATLAGWHPLGPSPIPNGSSPYSGRVTSIAVDPTDANVVYVGTAQGGLYRTLDGGTSWTPLMDNALSLSIGAVAIAPSDHTTVFVGTGEASFSADSFFGVGIYRITNANSSPTVSGPLNLGTSGTDVFSGRSISKIIVHPTDPNILFAATASGTAGIGGSSAGLILPGAGLYRTTTAMSASPAFEKLTIQGLANQSRSVIDLATEPGNPAMLLAAVVGSGSDGGIYRTVNALDAAPAFTRSLATADGSSASRTQFAVNKVGGVTTVYASNGTNSGTVYKSVDGGVSFVSTVNNQFCKTGSSDQCWYDQAIAVDPTDASKVYLGGSPALAFGRSTNGGTSFTSSSAGLHVDTHAIAVAPSDPNTIYFGSDGGVWKSTNGGTSWTSLNNSTFSATQFTSIAVHPTDRNYTLGGTQDNGTQFLAPDGTSWMWSDGGDGGFIAIDQNATDTTNLTAYHTYFNSSGSQIGFSRATTTVSPGDPAWGRFIGCGGTGNGINCSDAVLFYAPMVLGPNAPGSTGNTVYFGTSRLYRSTDQGTTMTDVSGVLPGSNTRISAIAIAPQSDDVRLVGTTNGTVFLSTAAGATTMTNVTGSIPARYIGRVAIDPANSSIAYVTLNGFGLASGQHVWKTTNLLSGSPTWSPAGSGIPDVPVNAFAIDPANSQSLYAGTDIGVFRSTDGGASWTPFSDGLPRVAVFGMAIQPTSHVLRIATHGRGIWETDLTTPTFSGRRTAFDFDGDGKTDVGIFRPNGATGGGEWWVSKSADPSVLSAAFGSSTDIPVPADYTGDGKTDIAFYRPSTGTWYILRSEDSLFYGFPFGNSTDIPAPADYDGDGKADAAVFRNGAWYILRSSDGGVTSVQFGIAGDKPVPADFDGDGKADIAVYRPNGATGGEWWVLKSSGGVFSASFGNSTDKAVVGDYTGDGKADCAFFRPSTGTWYILRSEDMLFYGFPFGNSTDTPAPGDYDGDGKTDAAVFRQPNQWYVNKSSGGVMSATWGSAGDSAVPGSYVR